MKHLLFLSLVFVLWNKYHKIYDKNILKEEAAIAYASKDFDRCISNYEKLIQKFNETDERVLLNLAHAYYLNGINEKATFYYKGLLQSSDPTIQSTAFLQLGIIYSAMDKNEMSLYYFKQAVKANATNDIARFNYEFQKIKNEINKSDDTKSERKKENSNGKNQMKITVTTEIKRDPSKENTTSVSQEKSSKQSDETNFDEEFSDEESSDFKLDENGKSKSNTLISKRLEEVNIPLQQAKAILNSMQKSEIQYIQQRKKVIAPAHTQDMPNW